MEKKMNTTKKEQKLKCKKCGKRLKANHWFKGYGKYFCSWEHFYDWEKKVYKNKKNWNKKKRRKEDDII